MINRTIGFDYMEAMYGAPSGKKLFWAYLDHNLSDIYIGNIRLIYRTNCALSRTKQHAQNKSDISDLHIGQIVP